MSLIFLSPEEVARWAEIKSTFQRNTIARGTGGEDDPVGRVVAQLHGFQDGLSAIRDTIASQIDKPAPAAPPFQIDLAPVGQAIASLREAILHDREAPKEAPKTPKPKKTPNPPKD